MNLRRTVEILSVIATSGDAGRHFSEVYSDAELSQLEAGGLIEITRPIHEATGLPYSVDHWSVAVTEDGQILVDNYPEYWHGSVAE
jgi:hypothetical protein